MNIRIEEGNVRFRITPDDYNVLSGGGELRGGVNVGTGIIGFRIVPVQAEESTRLEAVGCNLDLFVSRSMLEELNSLGRSKSGIVIRQGDAEISLQIDMKQQKKTAA